MVFNSWCQALKTLKESVENYVGHTNRLYLASIEFSAGPSASGWPGQGDSKGDPDPADIMTVEQALIYIDSAVPMLDDMEMVLRASRACLQGIRNNSVSLSPIARLPTDVLRIIIARGHEDNEIEVKRRITNKHYRIFESLHHDPAAPTLDLQHFPTKFSHVCRRWREVALDVPRVWTHIAFRPGHSEERIAEWIRRSKQSDLSLELSVGTEVEAADLQRALGIIGSNMTRARSAVLSVQKHHHLLQVLSHIGAYGQTSPLKRLEIISRAPIFLGENLTDSPREIFKLINGMRGLMHVRLQRVFLPLGNSVYRGLKTLHLDGIETHIEPGELPGDRNLRTIFRECPELESLALVNMVRFQQEDENEETSGWVEPPITQLQKLKTLTIHSVPLLLTRFVFSTFCAPSLERLTISRWMEGCTTTQLEASDAPTVLQRFFENLRPESLKYLNLDGDTFGLLNLHVEQLLARTPELEFLFGGGPTTIGDAVLGAMLGTEPLVHKLEDLCLNSCVFSASNLVTLVEQRNNPGSERPIRGLVVSRCKVSDMHPSVLHNLRQKVGNLVWGGNLEMEGTGLVNQ